MKPAEGVAPDTPWHSQSVQQTLAALTTFDAGLLDQEAELRLQRFGPNEIQAAKPTSWLRILANHRSRTDGLVGLGDSGRACRNSGCGTYGH